VVLRRPAARDVDEVTRLASHRRVLRHMLLPSPYRREHAEFFLRFARTEARRRTGLHFVIADRVSDVALGAIGLNNVRWHHRRAELGYWLGVPHHGRGIVTEAGRRLLAWSFGVAGFRRLHAFTFVGNEPSEAVLVRLGFLHEGTLREEAKQRGRYRDLKIWGLLRSEWSRRPQPGRLHTPVR
jgi:RimJ/RimL family protein N-acetyltransferase